MLFCSNTFEHLFVRRPFKLDGENDQDADRKSDPSKRDNSITFKT